MSHYRTYVADQLWQNFLTPENNTIYNDSGVFFTTIVVFFVNLQQFTTIVVLKFKLYPQWIIHHAEANLSFCIIICNMC